ASIADMEHVTGVVELPDVHFKPGMEAPSSIVVGSRRITPHYVSESINDGMGVVVTDLHIDEVGPEVVEGILTYLNVHGVKRKNHQGRYSWDEDQVLRVCHEGAKVVVESRGLDDQGRAESLLESMEDGGVAWERPLTADDVRAHVPGFLLGSPVSRGETGLNFGGNHFAEVQAVTDVLDQTLADRLDLSPGQLVVMYHLGPGPLGSILSNLSAFREKPPIHRKAGYGLGRLLLHSRRGLSFLNTFGLPRRWLAVDPDSPEGEHLATVLAIIKNYGYAYRMTTVAAVIDAVAEATGRDRSRSSLLVDCSHNILQPEKVGGDDLWVSRHNCCRVIPEFPGIVAGSHQVSSCLTVGPEEDPGELAGYDHGIGFLLDLMEERGEPPVPHPSGVSSVRLKMKRGHNEIVERRTFPLLGSEPILETIKELEQMNAVRGAVLTRPVGTLKHV
ncbi:MAG: RtcB family protein, partial [Acidimicrobiia bacterium]|nr:RtcB family protein [Acidimicrobiia bacterium]